MNIVEASWSEHLSALQAVRKAVFVKEQSVPEEFEWDGEDDRAYHWLALDKNRAIGTVRMLRDGHLGRLAVLPEHRKQGVGKDLLNKALRHAKMLNLREAWLYSQQPAIGFYQQFGFEAYGPIFQDAGIPHQSMRLRLRENFILGKDAGKHAVTDLADKVASLASQSRHQLRIFSESLNTKIYDNDKVRCALSELARLHKSTEIRILVLRPEQLAGRGHRLLELQQRLNSSIYLRALPEDQAGQVDEEFLVADNAGLLVSKRTETNSHWADFSNRPSALNYILQFDLLWNQASEDSRLRRLSLI
jgi:predicted GNAT family N-acyltransferase